LVVCEGAGSPAEINLRKGDYVILGLAREFGLPVVVVGDIDRGGVLASLYGTWALLDDADRALLRAFLINKFRGDVSVLEPGLDEITRRTGVPFRGVIPWLLDVWLDSEDTVAVGHWRASTAASPTARDRLRVAVVRLPRISNATDVDALAAERGVDVLVTVDPSVVEAADLVVLPGSRSTASDLGWLRERGLAAALIARAAAGRPLLGICGGYQMLAREIRDDVECEVGTLPGLGLLPIRVEFGAEKMLGRPTGTWRGHVVDSAYEIHHGIAHALADRAPGPERFLDGWRWGSVWGTMWHGAFESDGFRRGWLSEIAAGAGSDWRPTAGAPGFGERREHMLDTLADALEAHVDIDALLAPTRAARTELAR
ncbi:MAG TPA: cobyric acid synthase, partial [Pedococcus sp.]|nr:cobyric acid synthase [Pedococcus sp.]